MYNQSFCYGHSPLLNSFLYVHVSLALADPTTVFPVLPQPAGSTPNTAQENASTTTMVYQALLPSSFVFLCKFAEGVKHCPYQKTLPVLLALSPFPGLKMKLTGLQFPWSPRYCRECHWLFSSILASHHDFPKITEWLCKVSTSLSTWKCIPSGPFTHS